MPRLGIVLAALVVTGCGGAGPSLPHISIPGEATAAGSGLCPSSTVTVTKMATLGDSITWPNFQAPHRAYPTELKTLLPWTWRVDNAGLAGDETQNMTSRANTLRNKGYGYVAVLGGVNDIGSYLRDAATVSANLTGIYDALRLNGIVVVPITITPWKQSVVWSAGKQTITESVNADILAYCVTHELTCVDANTALESDENPDFLEEDYSEDSGAHLNQAGATRLAELVRAVLP